MTAPQLYLRLPIFSRSGNPSAVLAKNQPSNKTFKNSIYVTRICFFRRLLLWWRNTQKFSHSCSRATAKFIHDQNIFSSYSQGTTSEWRRKWVCPTKQNEPHDSIHVQSLRIKLNVKIGLLLSRLLVFLAGVNTSNSQALNS